MARSPSAGRARSVRAALGAGRGALLALGLSIVLRAFVSGLRFDVAPTDPATFAAVPLVLLAVSLVACAVPAWRAARVVSECSGPSQRHVFSAAALLSE